MLLKILKSSQNVLLFSVLSLFLIQCTDDELVSPTVVEDELDTQKVSASATASAYICSSCTYVVPPNKTTVDGKLLGLKPGAVICLSSGTVYPNIVFTNLEGTSNLPITISNCGGEVTIDTPGKPYVIKVENSKFFRVTGGNVNGAYGIKLKGSSSNGLVLGPFATNFSVDHLEVYNVGFSGIMAKTDPTCDDATVRGNFTMRNVAFFHNYIHDTGGEGLYIGHSAYGGVSTSCGWRLPHTIEGVKIYRNRVSRSGWDGIQLSSAPIGAYINNNVVENYATKQNSDQSSGIAIGGGTGGVCHSNIVSAGFGAGITVFGLADNLVHNNIIVNAGAMGIFCDERTDPKTGYKFLNNTIVNPKAEGLKIYAEKVPNNVFINNIVVNPGNGKYITKLNNAVPLESENNYLTLDVTEVKFLNPGAANFKLTSASPAINGGKDIQIYNISRAYYNLTRFAGGYYDIGASEFQP